MRVPVARLSMRLLLLLFLGSAACGSGAGSGVNATGGSTATTGGVATLGGTNSSTGGAGSTGGAVSAGGTTTTPAGGAASTGGLVASGGTIGSSGGAGGPSMTGGARTGGSSANAGGTTGSGGSSPGGACIESSCGSHKWACWKVPTPASLGLPNAQNYTDLGNGAVRDNLTCLVWEKANPGTQGDWQASVDRCAALATSNYAGYGDWRMPTRMEMASIVDPTVGSKGYATIFTVSTPSWYATGSWWYETITGQNTSGFHWGYATSGLTSNAVAMSGTNLVARCVRGNGAGEAANVLAVEPPNHYTISIGEVTDNYTGLVWQQGFSPSLLAWADAPAYCNTLSINGHTGFRMPTLSELSSTVNEAKVGSAVVATAFPGNPNGCKDPKYWFWTVEASKAGGTAWGLSYCDGFTAPNYGALGASNYFPTANVRCVRNGP